MIVVIVSSSSLSSPLSSFPSTVRHSAEEILKRHNWICVWGKLSHRNHMNIVTTYHRLWKAPFSPTRKWKADVFKFVRFEERFRKTPIFAWVSVDGSPNWRNEAPFSISSGIIWTALDCEHRGLTSAFKKYLSDYLGIKKQAAKIVFFLIWIQCYTSRGRLKTMHSYYSA